LSAEKIPSGVYRVGGEEAAHKMGNFEKIKWRCQLSNDLEDHALNVLLLLMVKVYDLHVYSITIYKVKRKSARKVIDYRQA